MATNEGPWQKTNRMKERRNFATARPVANKDKRAGHIAKVPLGNKYHSFVDERDDVDPEETAFDPIQRDPFFVIVTSSVRWPPSAEEMAEVEKRVSAAQGATMAMYRREDGGTGAGGDAALNTDETVVGDENSSSAKRPRGAEKKKKNQKPGPGELKAPKGMDVSRRRKVIASDDEDDS
eukprot:PhF_6_TR12481/c0_g1_i1/m.19618